LIRYAIAVQCAEIIDKITVEEDPNENIYKLFSDTLMLLSDEQNTALLLTSFQWKLFSIIGYQPELNKCVNCSCHIKDDKHYVFDIAKGGIICNFSKNIENYHQISISSYCLKLLKRVINADLYKIHNKQVSKAELVELVKITSQYMSYHFEIKNRAKQFMDKIETII